MYIVQEGLAEVLISDRTGTEHLLSLIGAGGTLGEMALITGQPASATVRASTDVEVLVLTREQFTRIADSLPLVYRNLGAILSRRLTRTNSRLLHTARGRISLLLDGGGPPVLGFALASSVAWHTSKPTVFIAVMPDGAPDELVELTSNAPPAQFPPHARPAIARPPRTGVHTLLTRTGGTVAPRAARDARRAAGGLRHVLVGCPATSPRRSARQLHGQGSPAAQRGCGPCSRFAPGRSRQVGQRTWTVRCGCRPSRLTMCSACGRA
jgi:hypothetical protein